MYTLVMSDYLCVYILMGDYICVYMCIYANGWLYIFYCIFVCMIIFLVLKIGKKWVLCK